MTRAALAALALAAASAAHAHEAVSGWRYDAACCSDRDCIVMPFGVVNPTSDGWRVQIQAGMHHYFPGALDEVVPYGDRRERKSGDTEFHLCLSRTGRLLCLYVPEMSG